MFSGIVCNKAGFTQDGLKIVVKMVRLQAMNLSRPILKSFYISIAIGGYLSACSAGARGSLDLRTSSTNVISVQCGHAVVQLFRFADPNVKTEWGEPKALLKVADKEFIGTLTQAGFPRGFNLADTLLNDDTFWNFPSLLWFQDGSIKYRKAGPPSGLISCKKI